MGATLAYTVLDCDDDAHLVSPSVLLCLLNHFRYHGAVGLFPHEQILHTLIVGADDYNAFLVIAKNAIGV